ncbi:MAG: hypothetical protein Ct9H300mP23_09160 [Nitrospinota bacterium]|nr:MAG: hypothetical protein Ct9H300mP23_09160 [Nitrospinota bacterium]
MVFMFPLVWAALLMRGKLSQILKIKFELLGLMCPAIYLGVHSNR